MEIKEQSEVCDGYTNYNDNNDEDEEELESLFSRENRDSDHSASDSDSRRPAVEWVVRVSNNYGFATRTAVLAVSYLDKFLCKIKIQRDRKPWTARLAAVACLSLAAKMGEAQAPPISDLQAQETEHVFEAETVQRMELLVLSTLRWKMNPVTPISFLDHIIGRLGLIRHRLRFERLLLSAVADPRFVGCLPSIVAGATAMRIIDQFEPSNAINYQNQLLGFLKISKGEVNGCYELVSELSGVVNNNRLKRRYGDRRIPTSPSGVIEVSLDYSDDSCSSTSSVCSSARTEQGLFKKSKKTHQEHSRVTSINLVSVDFVGESS